MGPSGIILLSLFFFRIFLDTLLVYIFEWNLELASQGCLLLEIWMVIYWDYVKFLYFGKLELFRKMCHPIHEHAVPFQMFKSSFVTLTTILKCFLKKSFKNVEFITCYLNFVFVMTGRSFPLFISSNLLLVYLWKVLTTFALCFAMFWIHRLLLVLLFVYYLWFSRFSRDSVI